MLNHLLTNGERLVYAKNIRDIHAPCEKRKVKRNRESVALATQASSVPPHQVPCGRKLAS